MNATYAMLTESFNADTRREFDAMLDSPFPDEPGGPAAAEAAPRSQNVRQLMTLMRTGGQR